MKIQARKKFLNSIAKRAKQVYQGMQTQITLNKIIKKELINYILKKINKKSIMN